MGVLLGVFAVRVFFALFIINAVCSIPVWVVLEHPGICSPSAIINLPPFYSICKTCIDSTCVSQGENTALLSEPLLAAAALRKHIRPDFHLL